MKSDVVTGCDEIVKVGEGGSSSCVEAKSSEYLSKMEESVRVAEWITGTYSSGEGKVVLRREEKVDRSYARGRDVRSCNLK